MAEDRLLRMVVIEQVETGLGRRMDQPEQIALDTAIDEMLQQAVAAFIAQQNAQLRRGAQAELKYLSFLSHDLNNSLGAIMLMLQSLRTKLAASDEFLQDVDTIDAAQQAIQRTMAGMGRLLEAERLRGSHVQPKHQSLELHSLVSQICAIFSDSAKNKGLAMSVDVPSGLVVNTDGDLISLALQNLISNAVKYSSAGTVSIRASTLDGTCTLRVSDQGPGISPEFREHLFEAFQRGNSHGQPGMGLGLSIAARAAALIGGDLTAASTDGDGSTFSLTFPYH